MNLIKEKLNNLPNTLVDFKIDLKYIIKKYSLFYKKNKYNTLIYKINIYDLF